MNGDDKGGTINRGPSDIVTDGPHEPKEPPPDKPVAIALHDAIQQIANLRLEINELRRRLEALEGK
jgi:hypothetical protein